MQTVQIIPADEWIHYTLTSKKNLTGKPNAQ